MDLPVFGDDFLLYFYRYQLKNLYILKKYIHFILFVEQKFLPEFNYVPM